MNKMVFFFNLLIFFTRVFVLLKLFYSCITINGSYLRSYGISPVEDSVPKPVLCDTKLTHNGYPCHSRNFDTYKSTENRQESNQLDSYDSTPVRWKRRCLKRSPSYTNAVEVASDDITEKHKVRFNEGKFYIGIDNDSSDPETFWLVVELSFLFNFFFWFCLVVFLLVIFKVLHSKTHVYVYVSFVGVAWSGVY